MYIFFPAPSIAITAAKIPAHLTMDLIYALDRMYQPGGVFGPGLSPSPGGGGPGQSLISTNPPPSVEEVGQIISRGYPMKGGRPESKKASRGRSRKRCPNGYRWNGHRCVRKD